MRLLVDLTNSPHVPFFAPLVRLLEADGHDVVVTARRFAQTIELAERHGLDVTVIGEHGGSSRTGKARAALGRTASLARFARSRARASGRFDVAMSHGSTDLPIVARLLGTPHVTAFDYEWATTMHRINCRASWRVVTPASIPVERLDAYGAAGKVSQYAGLKEEYYLDPAALDPDGLRRELGIERAAVLVVLRPPADMALYHRGIVNDVFAMVLDRARTTPEVTTVLLPRTAEQRDRLVRDLDGDPSVIVPEHAIDGASLVAAADVVVSAGGTMNREAAALGVPVHSVFAGRIGGVDEALLADGRLRRLANADEVELVPRAGRLEAAEGADPLVSLPAFRRRDPRVLLEALIGGVPA